MLLWLQAYEEIPPSCRCSFGKWRNILMAFSGNCGYSLVFDTWHLGKDYSQWGISSCVSERLYSAILKSIGLSCTLDLSPIDDFVISGIAFWENIGSLSYRGLNIDTHSIIKYQRSYLLISPLVSSEKSLNIGKLLSSWWQSKFSNLLIFTWKLSS